MIDIDSFNGMASQVVLSANEQSDVEIDKDAKWLKKGGKNIFGYKNFVTTDRTDGYIEAVSILNYFHTN